MTGDQNIKDFFVEVFRMMREEHTNSVAVSVGLDDGTTVWFDINFNRASMGEEALTMDEEVTIRLTLREFYALTDALSLSEFEGNEEEKELLLANNPYLASAYDKILAVNK